MFGYIKPQQSELLVREFEQYKGVYCSLCRQLGKSYGAMARMTLSYDCTFLAMLMMSRSDECCGFEKGRCVVNPLKKCTFNKGEQPELVFASALSAIMTYYKVKDDLRDPGWTSRIRAVFFLPFASRAHKKAAREFPALEGTVAQAMELQRQTEQQKDPPLDACAEPTAQMLSGVFSQLTEPDSPEFRILEQFGYFLGRWVYLMDAADDIPKDLKKNAFNPFVRDYGLTTQSTDEQMKEAADRCNQVLNMTVSQAIAAFQLLDLRQFASILTNIVCLGLPQMQKEFMQKWEKEKNDV
ncbi:DUF5685 family protein [Clostridium minihomine]|uniref:DUF5685 family protein n=1 Tax=Clostridium minihomine TaxID=2045012 RepID=UPI000C788E14|nr:DUF5685 family protein [Clostridium minihomine]